MARLLALASILPSLVQCATFPEELFSPLIPSKILAASSKVPSDLSSMPYEADTATGKYGLHGIDWWTSGYFPATPYAVYTRSQLCEPTEQNGLGSADWLELGRALTKGVASLSGGNGQGHDQGFLTFPLQADIQM